MEKEFVYCKSCKYLRWIEKSRFHSTPRSGMPPDMYYKPGVDLVSSDASEYPVCVKNQKTFKHSGNTWFEPYDFPYVEVEFPPAKNIHNDCPDFEKTMLD